MITPVPPAYTIGKSSHKSLNKDDIPGPTDYDPYYNLRASVPMYSFSKSPRKIHDIYQIPGPGVYSPVDKKRTSGFTISKSPRILSNINNVSPGPGDYSYSVSQARYQYSISKARTKSYNFSESPGPGYYSPNTTINIQNTPRIKFPKQ